MGHNCRASRAHLTPALVPARVSLCTALGSPRSRSRQPHAAPAAPHAAPAAPHQPLALAPAWMAAENRSCPAFTGNSPNSHARAPRPMHTRTQNIHGGTDPLPPPKAGRGPGGHEAPGTPSSGWRQRFHARFCAGRGIWERSGCPCAAEGINTALSLVPSH